MKLNRKVKFYAGISMTVLGLAMAGCGDEEIKIEPVIPAPEPPLVVDVDTDDDRFVYVSFNESINGVWVPGLVNPDGTVVRMTDGKRDAHVDDLYMGADMNLHAVGWSTNAAGKMFAVYWGNCSFTLLSDSLQGVAAYATGVMSSGADVYVSGVSYKNGHTIAVYWKNGELVELSDGTTDAHTLDIFVSGNDVYVAGTMENSREVPEAHYWKNGEKVKLLGTYVSSVSMSGEEVYATGDFGEGKYWKDGTYEALGKTEGPGTVAVSIAAESVCFTSPGKYWKNGKEFSLVENNNTPAVMALLAFQDDVYVGGYVHKGSKLMARYWKNGVAVDVTDGTNNASCSGIAVVSTR
jgi:hypothetical protein